MCIPPESQQSAVRLDDPAPGGKLIQNRKKSQHYTQNLFKAQGHHTVYSKLPSQLAGKRDLSEKQLKTVLEAQNQEETFCS